MGRRNGFKKDVANATLDIQVDGTEALTLNNSAPYATVPSGLTVTAGGALVTAGRIREVITPTDVNAQHNTLSAAQILAGIVVHTSAVGGGTVTLDTAANIIAGVPLSADSQSVMCYYVNDGTQTLTFAADGGATVTLSDAAQTVAADEAALLVVQRTGAATVTVYILGA